MSLPTLPDLLTWLFAGGALAGGVTMLAARHPMRVALALIGTMLCLGGLYAALAVHVIAVFQVLIYVGAVMVFMVFVIMLLDVRDASFVERHSRWLWPGMVSGALLTAALAPALLGVALGAGGPLEASPALTEAGAMRGYAAPAPGGADWRIGPFSVEFLERHWLLFELTSVLLVAAVVAAIAVLRTGEERDAHD
jgi:NADH-quinone oxidoreductase subunit J